MSTAAADAVSIARRIPEEVATQGRLELIEELCAPDVVDHAPFGESTGREGFRRNVQIVRDAFEDFTAVVEETVAEGDLVAMRLTLSGTHTGEFMGIPPTNRRFEVSNMVFTRVEDGHIVERWVQPDMLGMLQQLGVVDRFDS